MAFLDETGLAEVWDITKSLIDEKGVERVLLWKNASPASAFAAQTITLDLTKYSDVQIFFDGGVGTATYTMAKKGFSSNMVVPPWVTNVVTRTIQPTDSGVYIGDCYLLTQIRETHNDYYIPKFIYGIKGE